MKLFRPLILFALVLTACQPVPVTQAPPPSAPAATAPPRAPTATPAPTLPPTRTPTLTAIPPTPTATPATGIAAVAAGDWVTGAATARVTVIMYGDYQSPACAELAPILEQLSRAYPADVRIIYRHFPMIWLTAEQKPFHDKAELATEAAEAAGAQGKFWEMHQLLYQNYPTWVKYSPAEFRPLLETYAAQIGLDGKTFAAALDAQTYAQRVQDALVAALRYSLATAPFVLFNGEPYQGPKDYWSFDLLVRLEKFKDRQFTTRPPEIIDPFLNYVATLHTDQGDIVIELFAEKTPLTVNNFVFLAQSHWYDGMSFHFVTPDYVLTGDPSGTGFGGPGYFVPDELLPELQFDAPGWVGMANNGPDTNGSQFFITRRALPQLNQRHTLFGRVVQGLGVLERLTPRDPGADPQAPPGDIINSVTIEEQ